MSKAHNDQRSIRKDHLDASISGNLGREVGVLDKDAHFCIELEEIARENFRQLDEWMLAR